MPRRAAGHFHACRLKPALRAALRGASPGGFVRGLLPQGFGHAPQAALLASQSH